MTREMRKRKLWQQSDVTEMRTQGIDLGPRWQSILEEIVSKTGFSPDRELLRKSEWWKTGKIGAVHCPGFIDEGGEKLRTVLKIQGTKPPTSEAIMIEAFQRQNRSKLIRSPKVFVYLSWDEEKQYEAIIMEEVCGKPVMTHHPATDNELDTFFDLYEEYRGNCRGKPWVVRPESWSYKEQVKRWRAAVEHQAKDDPLRLSEDEDLAEQGIRIIEKNLSASDLEFVHGHFQPGDLIPDGKDRVVLFSNLFWSWRIPFYDAVFGYHWWMLGMEHADNLATEILGKERRRWVDKIFNLSEIKENSKNILLVNLALLERAVPALMVDRYMLDFTNPQTSLITENTRKELKRLIEELS